MVNRKKGNNIGRKWKWFILVLMVIVLIVGIFIPLPLYNSSFASVKIIEIVPSQNYISISKLKTYVSMCGEETDFIWSKPSDEMRACIKEKNPLISDVKFAYWDGRLQVKIMEPNIIYSVKTASSIYYISDDSRFFRIDVFDNLPATVTQFSLYKTGTISQIDIKGLTLLYYSQSCQKLFNEKGLPQVFLVMPQYVQLIYVNNNQKKYIIVPLYDLQACDRVNRYWDTIWGENGDYVDFTHRRVIVFKEHQ